MASGRWAGMAVRPLPRQSTMLLLQEHMGGQEPDARLHGWTKALSPWPANKRGENKNSFTSNIHTWTWARCLTGLPYLSRRSRSCAALRGWGPSAREESCTECRGLKPPADAATETTRPGDSHSAGSSSGGDWEEKEEEEEERDEMKVGGRTGGKSEGGVGRKRGKNVEREGWSKEAKQGMEGANEGGGGWKKGTLGEERIGGRT